MSLSTIHIYYIIRAVHIWTGIGTLEHAQWACYNWSYFLNLAYQLPSEHATVSSNLVIFGLQWYYTVVLTKILNSGYLRNCDIGHTWNYLYILLSSVSEVFSQYWWTFHILQNVYLGKWQRKLVSFLMSVLCSNLEMFDKRWVSTVHHTFRLLNCHLYTLHSIQSLASSHNKRIHSHSSTRYHTLSPRI